MLVFELCYELVHNLWEFVYGESHLSLSLNYCWNLNVVKRGKKKRKKSGFLGCPGAKKNEFLTSVLDALSTDMVHAVSDPSLSSSRWVSDPFCVSLKDFGSDE